MGTVFGDDCHATGRRRSILPATLGGGRARCRTGRRVRRAFETSCHRKPADLAAYGASDLKGWVSTRIAPVAYLPVSRCFDGCRSVSRGSCALAAGSRKSQVRGSFRVHGWIYPAYRPARRTKIPLTWAFGSESCPKCPRGSAPIQHRAESFAFAQVNASQDSNRFLNVPEWTRLTTYCAVCEMSIEAWFGRIRVRTRGFGCRALRSAWGRFGPWRVRSLGPVWCCDQLMEWRLRIQMIDPRS